MSKRLLAVGLVGLVALAVASFSPGPTPPGNQSGPPSLPGINTMELTLANSPGLQAAEQYDPH